MVKVAQSNKFMRGSSSFGMNQKDTAEHKSPHFLEQKTHPSFALRMFLSATRKQRSSSKVGSCFAWSVQGQRRGTLDGFIFFSPWKNLTPWGKKMAKGTKKNSCPVNSGSWIVFFSTQNEAIERSCVFLTICPTLGNQRTYQNPKSEKENPHLQKVPAPVMGDSFVPRRFCQTIHG